MMVKDKHFLFHMRHPPCQVNDGEGEEFPISYETPAVSGKWWMNKKYNSNIKPSPNMHKTKMYHSIHIKYHIIQPHKETLQTMQKPLSFLYLRKDIYLTRGCLIWNRKCLSVTIMYIFVLCMLGDGFMLELYFVHCMRFCCRSIAWF
jgi:hypothetical protein